MPRKQRAKVVVRGGEVPQDKFVPAWRSDTFNAEIRDIARISETNPQDSVGPTPTVRQRIKAVIHGLHHPALKPLVVNGVGTQRTFKLCFKGW